MDQVGNPDGADKPNKKLYVPQLPANVPMLTELSSYDPRVWYAVLVSPVAWELLTYRQGSRGRENNVKESVGRIEGFQHSRSGLRSRRVDDEKRFDGGIAPTCKTCVVSV